MRVRPSTELPVSVPFPLRVAIPLVSRREVVSERDSVNMWIGSDTDGSDVAARTDLSCPLIYVCTYGIDALLDKTTGVSVAQVDGASKPEHKGELIRR